MVSQYDSLIQDLQNNIGDVNTSEDDVLSKVLNPLKTITIPIELQGIQQAFQSQHDSTKHVSELLHNTNNFPLTNATLEQFHSAINLVQLYFQGSKPLPQILSNLIDGIENLDSSITRPDQFRQKIQKILDKRQVLQKTLNRVLREFVTEIDEQDLQQLVQKSSMILNEMNSPNPANSDELSHIIQEFIGHLKQAQVLFKTFRKKGEDLTGNEPDEIKQLILNWEAAINRIKKIEQTDPEIQNDLNNDVNKSREAIAQSIKIHELLEQNYDSLNTLVRSGDLESAGIL